MTNRSPLRQLARAYYDGKISRDDYTAQRQRLLSSLDVEATGAAATGDSGHFDALDGPQPDAIDLASALANRGGGEHSADALTPDLSAPAPEPSIAIAPQPPKLVAPTPVPAVEKHWGRRLMVFLLLVVAICCAIVASVFYL